GDNESLALGKKPDTVWPISQSPFRCLARTQKSADSVGTIRGPACRNSIDAVDRIAAIKNPDGVCKIPQTLSAKSGIHCYASRGCARRIFGYSARSTPAKPLALPSSNVAGFSFCHFFAR